VSFELLVARQAGVVALHQAVGFGMSADTVQRRVRTGAAAAHWHGMLSRAPAVVGLTVPAASEPRPRPGIALRRRDLDPVDRMLCRQVEVAAEPFAALETAVEEGSAFLDRVLQRRLVGFPALYRSYTRNLGRPGSADAGRLLVAAADRADSAAERLLVRILRDAGVTGWVLGHPFGPYRIDLAFPERRVAVEVDGWAWHVDVERFRTDRRKGDAITRASWDLLRFTWHDLDGDPGGCLREITETLALPRVIGTAGT
jgi:very-short-patch-repair endonuclease